MKRFIVYFYSAIFLSAIILPEANCSNSLPLPLSRPISGNDTLEVSYERYYPVLKSQLEYNLKQARKFSNLSLAAVPLGLITIGISYLAGIALSIISLYFVARIRKMLSDFPELEDDPLFASKIRKCYLRISLVAVGLLVFPALLISLLINFLSGPGALFLIFTTAILAITAFFLLDWLVFRIKKTMV